MSVSLLVKSCPMCIRLNKLAQVKLSSATLKTNICGTQTLSNTNTSIIIINTNTINTKTEMWLKVSEDYHQIITNHLSTVPRQGSSFLLVLFLLIFSTLKLCLLCGACHLSSETWYNLSQSTNTEKAKNRSWCWNYGNTSYKYL